MNALLQNLIELAQLLGWAILWILGGWWIARSAFRLAEEEEGLVGLCLGLVCEIILFNFIARILPVAIAAWLAAALVFVCGLGLAVRLGWRQLLNLRITTWHWLTIGLIVVIFFPISQGMAIFDDFAHLPTLSTMATGEIPPRFSLDPTVPYGYHYLLHLLAAQIMGIGRWYIWNAWDLARVISLALAVPLAIQWTRRVTGSYIAGVLAGIMVLFASGTRWLLLFLPETLLNSISQRVVMLGSGLSSGNSLSNALVSAWAFEGGGPFPLPFAFANGLIAPGVLNVHASTGMMATAVTLLLLLTFNRMRSKFAPIVLAVLISSTGLLGETSLLINLAGWGLISLVWALRSRSLRLPPGLLKWWGILCGAWLLIAVQGGAWSDTLYSLANKIFFGQRIVSYQTVGFELLWPPAIISSHLGILPFGDPLTLLAGLLEAGPLPLLLPLIVAWGWKALKLERWFEAALAAEAFLSLFSFWVIFSGSTGIRNTPRLYSFLPISLILSIPLLWWWLQRRKWATRAIVAGFATAAISSGLVIFFLQLPAIRQPVYSYFLTTPDMVMIKNFWNRLEKDALVFDPQASRGVTVFGRHTNAAFTWYQFKPEFEALLANPDPRLVREQGYDYIYLDEGYWGQLPLENQALLQSPCIKLVKEVTENNLWRQLLDIRGCQ